MEFLKGVFRSIGSFFTAVGIAIGLVIMAVLYAGAIKLVAGIAGEEQNYGAIFVGTSVLLGALLLVIVIEETFRK